MVILVPTVKGVCVYLIDIAQPFADVFKALGIGDIVDQHDTHGSSVVGGGDGVEPFLACCVPSETHVHKDRQLFFVFITFIYITKLLCVILFSIHVLAIVRKLPIFSESNCNNSNPLSCTERQCAIFFQSS